MEHILTGLPAIIAWGVGEPRQVNVSCIHMFKLTDNAIFCFPACRTLKKHNVIEEKNVDVLLAARIMRPAASL